MNQTHNRSWKILTWNVRGINSPWKWNPIKNKIIAAQCDIICIQETKKDVFDLPFLRKICPSQFDSFDYLPSVGTSGGILVAWKSTLFTTNTISNDAFGITVEFSSKHNNNKWNLICVYAPCTA